MPSRPSSIIPDRLIDPRTQASNGKSGCSPQGLTYNITLAGAAASKGSRSSTVRPRPRWADCWLNGGTILLGQICRHTRSPVHAGRAVDRQAQRDRPGAGGSVVQGRRASGMRGAFRAWSRCGKADRPKAATMSTRMAADAAIGGPTTKTRTTTTRRARATRWAKSTTRACPRIIGPTSTATRFGWARSVWTRTKSSAPRGDGRNGPQPRGLRRLHR